MGTGVLSTGGKILYIMKDMDMSIQFYKLAKIISKLNKKYLEVIRLDEYNYTDRS